MKKYDSTKSKWIQVIMFLFLMLILIDICILKIQYDNYREKIQIICKMIGEENALQEATDILKTGDFTDIKTGEKILNQYGYHLYDKNALYETFIRQSIIIISMSIVFALVLLAVFLILHKTNQKAIQRDIQIIEKLLSDYKQGIIDKHENINEQFDHEQFKDLYDDICSFGDTLKLLNDREIKEKESTKSLVSDISHQLKTPVAALKTSFEILQQNLSPEERAEFTQRCNVQILGIENLLGALINISRMEAGMIDIMLEKQSIFDTIVDSINRVYEKAEEKNIQIELDTKEELEEICIPHDKKWLCEAFINILENAMKYSSPNTNITIGMLKMTTFLRIEFCDEGIGIPQEEYNLIFKRFYRGITSVVKNQPGSGIGLYLTREIITRHHGTIRVEAGENKKGSRFIIQLPFQ